MIIRNAIKNIKNQQVLTLPDVVELMNPVTKSGQIVNVETCKNIATAYRCINILSNDVAKMPLQTFSTRSGKIDRIFPDRTMNISYLLEISPNRYMSPFTFKKTMMRWLINWGNAYAWYPLPKLGERPEIHILDADKTWPVFDVNGNLWYRSQFPNGSIKYIPDIEVLHLMINSEDGIIGKSVISHARETFGRQLGAYETLDSFYDQGLSAAGILWLNGEANKEANEKIRAELEEAISGSKNASRLAILDKKFTKYEQISINPADAQFLESIADNDVQIANFFEVPLYKLNQGKQSYESNSQQDLEYLKTTLDPYLVSWEDEAKLKWLSANEQFNTYFRFNRAVILRTDEKARTEVLTKKVQWGLLSINEARQIDDLSGYPVDTRMIPSNMAIVHDDGSVTAIGNNNLQINTN